MRDHHAAGACIEERARESRQRITAGREPGLAGCHRLRITRVAGRQHHEIGVELEVEHLRGIEEQTRTVGHGRGEQRRIGQTARGLREVRGEQPVGREHEHARLADARRIEHAAVGELLAQQHAVGTCADDPLHRDQFRSRAGQAWQPCERRAEGRLAAGRQALRPQHRTRDGRRLRCGIERQEVAETDERYRAARCTGAARGDEGAHARHRHHGETPHQPRLARGGAVAGDQHRERQAGERAVGIDDEPFGGVGREQRIAPLSEQAVEQFTRGGAIEFGFGVAHRIFDPRHERGSLRFTDADAEHLHRITVDQ